MGRIVESLYGKYGISLNEGASLDTYKGHEIYWDDTQGIIYIYTQPNGKGRVDFPSQKEAEEYIDSELDK